jgi:hypothetical protein
MDCLISWDVVADAKGGGAIGRGGDTAALELAHGVLGDGVDGARPATAWAVGTRMHAPARTRTGRGT